MIFKMAWRNIFLYPKKSLGALLSVMIAFITLSLFEGYMHGVRTMFSDTFSQRLMLGDVVIERTGIKDPGRAGIDDNAMDPKQTQWIEQYFARQDSGVTIRVRFVNVTGMVVLGSRRTIFSGIGYDPQEGAKMRGETYRWHTYAGMPLDQVADAKSPLGSVVLGRGIANVFGCHAGGYLEGSTGIWGYPKSAQAFTCGDEINPSVQIQANTEKNQANAMDFSVTGLMSTGIGEFDEYMLLLPLSNAQKLYDTQRVSYLTVALEDKMETGTWVKGFNQAATEAEISVRATPWRSHRFGKMYRDSVNFLAIFRNFVIAIILIIVVLAIINSFVKIVHERTRVIGTLRSIGYPPDFIVFSFAVEGLLLGICGTIIGIGASYGLQGVVNQLGITYKAGFLSENVPFFVDIVPSDFIWMSLLVWNLTLVATVVVAGKSARSPIVDLLNG